MNAHEDAIVSRRDFVKTTGKGLAAAIVASQFGDAVIGSAVQASSTSESWGILIDTTRCVGCNSCILACREVNEMPQCEGRPKRLDCESLSFVAEIPPDDASPSGRTVYVKRQCMHCLHPACVSACTVGALRKTPEGPVVYDEKRCIGCRYCQYACPFGVPTYEWNSPTGLIQKCQLCVDRLNAGDEPACIAACPTGALRFGRREALLAQAHAQILSNPGRYVDHVYGESEVGGTSVLYMSSVPFAELGFPTLGSKPIPRYAEMVMQETPVIAASVAVVATGLHWIMKRRELKLAQPAVPAVDEEDES